MHIFQVIWLKNRAFHRSNNVQVIITTLTLEDDTKNEHSLSKCKWHKAQSMKV